MPERIGNYQIVGPIGRGGMGTIYKAHDPRLDRLVALKVISTEAVGIDELRARLRREARAGALLNHPNIVTVYGMGDDDGQPFIVMELLEGEDLKQVIAKRTRLALQDKVSIMIQVCEGLEHAHGKGIVHRDIKPSNIFLTLSGRAKILDFGIARLVNAESVLTIAGRVLGSLRYASPEQMRGRMDHRSDIFSAGSVFYELLSMRPPFLAKEPIQLIEMLQTEDPPALDELDPGIPPALAAAIARAMRKDPAERFPDISAMRVELETVRRGLSGEAVGGLDTHPDGLGDRILGHPEARSDDLRARAGKDDLAPAAPAPTDTPRPLGLWALAITVVAAVTVVGLGSVLWLSPAPSTVPSVKAPATQHQGDRPAPTSERPDATQPSAPSGVEQAAGPSGGPPVPPMVLRPLTDRDAVSSSPVPKKPERVHAGRRSAAIAPPGAPPGRDRTSPLCSDILERASLGDPLTDEEHTMLTRDCR